MAVSIERVRSVIAQMTLEEKVALCGTSGSLVTRSLSRLKVEGVRLPYELGFSDESFFPLGCTFDRELVGLFGRARAMVALQKGEALGGTVNLGVTRSPFSAGSERMFSEDELVVSRLAEAYIGGSPLKMLGCGILGGENKYSTRWIEPRAMNELYLRPLVKLGKALGGVVLPAGTLNGEAVSANKRFVMRACELTDRQALLISEAGSIDDRLECAAAGAPFMLCDNPDDNRALYAAVKNGKLPEARIDRCLERLLSLVASYSDFKKNIPDFSVSTDITQKLACQSAVLLKNEGVLPLTGGYFAGGDITRAETEALGENVQYLKPSAFGCAAGRPLLLLLTCNENGGFDERHLKLVTSAERAGAETVAVLFAPRPADIKALEPLVKALFFMPVANDYTLEVLGKFMIGALDPGGKLPVTWAYSLADYPAHRYKKAEGRGMFCYDSVMSGYRFFKGFNRPALYPFGHGLSYTRFEISRVSFKADEKKISAEFVVKNVGALSGVTTVFLFVQVPSDNIFGLKCRLAAFERVALEKGESVALKTDVVLSDLAVYDYTCDEWLIPGGKYKISLGFSASDIVFTDEVKVAKSTRYSLGLDAKTVPSYYAEDDFNPLGADVEKVMGVPLIVRQSPAEQLCQKSEYGAQALKSACKKIGKIFGVRVEREQAEEVPARFLDKLTGKNK